VLRLEGEKDALAAELQTAQHQLQQQQPIDQPGADANAAAAASLQQLFELQLQRDQAHAAVQRLRSRLEELFGQGAADPSAQPAAGRSTKPTAAAGTGKRGGGGTAGGVGGAAKLSGREAELLSTVDNLRAALERAMAGSTPTTRFMQVGWAAKLGRCSKYESKKTPCFPTNTNTTP